MCKQSKHNDEAAIEQLIAHTLKASEIAGVKANEDNIRRVVETYSAYFAKSPIEFRTTSKPDEERGLDFRYVEIDEIHDPYQMAIKAGLLEDKGRSCDKLIPSLHNNEDIETMGYGVDAEVSYGLQKFWFFAARQYPMEYVYGLKDLPAYLKDFDSIFQRNGLTHFSIIAVDYKSESYNLYWMIPGVHTPESIGQIISDFGFEVPSQEDLEYNAKAGAINITFTWNSPKAQRICFYVPGPAEIVPAHKSPVLKETCNSVPIIGDRRMFIIGHTYGTCPHYLKIESDYTGTMLDAFMKCMSTPKVDAQA